MDAAVARQIERDNVNDLIAVAETEHGPVTAEEIQEKLDLLLRAREQQRTPTHSTPLWPREETECNDAITSSDTAAKVCQSGSATGPPGPLRIGGENMITGNETPLPGWRGGDGNAAYLDKTLRHRHIEMYLNESVDGKVIFQLWLRAAVVSFVVYLIPAFIGFIVLASSISDSSTSGFGTQSSGSGNGSGIGWFVFAGVASFVVFWVVLLLSRLPEPIGEWRVLLADRHDRAESVYGTIARTLSTRNYPITPKSFGTRLTLNERHYTAYISVFNYGSSLYLGWMMWRSRRGTELIGQFIGDLVRSMKGENEIEHQLLRSEGARAMREAVHLACREGLMVALEGAPTGGGIAAPPAMGHIPSPPVAPPTVPPRTGQFPNQPGQPQWGPGSGYANGG